VPKFVRHWTEYKGVYYLEVPKPAPRRSSIVRPPATSKTERIYYIVYRRGGRQVEEKAGRASLDEMTAAKASNLRSDRMRGKALPNRARRTAERKAKDAEAGRWTIDRLWGEWMRSNPHKKSIVKDDNRYRNHLEESFGDREPREILPLDVDRIRVRMLKTAAPPPGRKRKEPWKGEGKLYAVGTVKSVLSLLTRIANFGVKRQLCEGLRFKVEGPKGAKQKTEDMTEGQMAAYIRICREWPDPQAGNFQLLELYTGMRRGEVRNLKWSDVDLERRFLRIRDPKAGEDQVIPLNAAALSILEEHPKVSKCPYVFAGDRGSGPRGLRQIASSSRGIRDAAGLPADFRPNHGLRHTFASHLASSGEVDLYAIQRLLTHKNPTMTQRYAHLRDEALRKATEVMDALVSQAGKEQAPKQGKGKISG
jgi:integrase